MALLKLGIVADVEQAPVDGEEPVGEDAEVVAEDEVVDATVDVGADDVVALPGRHCE